MNTSIRIRTLFVALAAVSGLATALPAAADVVVSEGWTRATAPGAKAGFGFMVLRNTGEAERKLLTITSPVSDEITLYRANRDATGAMRMWPLNGIELEPGETLRMEPTGHQVSFGNIRTPFVVGQQIPLRLRFEGQVEITVMLEVRAAEPAAAATASAAPNPR